MNTDLYRISEAVVMGSGFAGSRRHPGM